MPFFYRIELSPLPVEPHRSRRKALLPQKVDRRNVIAPARVGRGLRHPLHGVHVPERGPFDKFRIDAIVLVVEFTASRPVDIIAGDALLRVRRPLQQAIGAVLFGVDVLRGRRYRQRVWRRASLDPQGVDRVDAVRVYGVERNVVGKARFPDWFSGERLERPRRARYRPPARDVGPRPVHGVSGGGLVVRLPLYRDPAVGYGLYDYIRNDPGL